MAYSGALRMRGNARRLALGTAVVVVAGLGYVGYQRFLGSGSCAQRDYRVAVELSKSPLMVPVSGAMATDASVLYYRSACEDHDGLGAVSLSFRGGGTPEAVAAQYRPQLVGLGYRELPKGPEGILCYKGVTKDGHPVNFSLSQDPVSPGDAEPKYLASLYYALNGKPWDCE